MVPVPVSQVVGPKLDLERTPPAALAHNLMLLRYVEFGGQLYRILSLLKARNSEFDPSIRRYTITREGMKLLESDPGADPVLSGITRLTSEARVKRGSEPEAE